MRINKGDIIRSGHAHMRRPMRGVEGPLFLTKDALLHEGSIGQHIEEIETMIYLKDIKDIKTKSSMGIIPNRLKVITTNNEVFKFTVFKRDDWIAAINEARHRLHTPVDE